MRLQSSVFGFRRYSAGLINAFYEENLDQSRALLKNSEKRGLDQDMVARHYFSEIGSEPGEQSVMVEEVMNLVSGKVLERVQGYTVLSIAIFEGDVAMVELILKEEWMRINEVMMA